jgi:hypothetical protein
MKLRNHKSLIAAWVVFVVGAVVVLKARAGAPVIPDAMPPMENLRLPLEYYPDGAVKAQLTAKTAVVLEGGNVDAAGVCVEMYGTNGVADGVITAESCLYNRQDGMLRSTNAVAFDRAEINISGMGLEWDVNAQLIKICTNAQVVLKTGIPMGFNLLGKVDLQSENDQ